jgi:hypothetical protein
VPHSRPVADEPLERLKARVIEQRSELSGVLTRVGDTVDRGSTIEAWPKEERDPLKLTDPLLEPLLLKLILSAPHHLDLIGAQDPFKVQVAITFKIGGLLR